MFKLIVQQQHLNGRTPNGVKYHGSLPQLFKVDGTSSSFVLPVYKSIFDDKADTAKLTNKESFTIITGPTGTTTMVGKKS